MEIKVTPYGIENTTGKEIDYNKLLANFGCYPVNAVMKERIEKLTKQPPHRFIRRDIFYAHRDLDLILNAYEKHE